jgi:serine/threonine protein kinase
METINGYEPLAPFTTAGGGLSKWTFARKEGKIYFLKSFLAPTYPVEGAPGSTETLEKKRQECLEFERRQRRVSEAVNRRVAEGGNLVHTRDFFRHGARYYKVTEKIDATGLSPETVAMMPLGPKLVLLKTVAHSLSLLHAENVVHADLKPDNILIKRTATGGLTAKLIDYDSGYLVGEAPSPAFFAGDPAYYAPETALYLTSGGPAPGLAADIYALGLLFCLWLYGRLPDFPGEWNYAHRATLEGRTLRVPSPAGTRSVGGILVGDDGVPARWAALVESMWAARPEDRPSAAQILEVLQDTPSAKYDGMMSAVRDVLRGTLASSTSKITPASSPPPAPSKLKGKLWKK